jgi:hypothetical protein
MTTAGAGRGAPWAARAEYSRNAAAERTAAL